jgi:hypothetical protein
VNRECEMAVSALQQRQTCLRTHEESTSSISADAVGRRVVVALYYDRRKRWIPFSGILEQLSDGVLSVCWDTAGTIDGIYELSYVRERSLFTHSRGRENSIDLHDPPPMLLLPDVVATSLGSRLTERELIRHFMPQTSSASSEPQRRRSSHFYSPSSLSEKALTLTVAELTPYHEEKSGGTDADSASESGDSEFVFASESDTDSASTSSVPAWEMQKELRRLQHDDRGSDTSGSEQSDSELTCAHWELTSLVT